MFIVSLLCDRWLKGRFDETDVKIFILFSSSLILSYHAVFDCFNPTSDALKRDFNFMQNVFERIYSFITSRISFINKNIT